MECRGWPSLPINIKKKVLSLISDSDYFVSLLSLWWFNDEQNRTKQPQSVAPRLWIDLIRLAC